MTHKLAGTEHAGDLSLASAPDAEDLNPSRAKDVQGVSGRASVEAQFPAPEDMGGLALLDALPDLAPSPQRSPVERVLQMAQRSEEMFTTVI